MAGNSFGKFFVVTTAGESHGSGIYAIVDGCPAGLELSISDIQDNLAKRRPGQNKLTSQRSEPDLVVIESGVFEGKTTGAPILLKIANQDARPTDYDKFSTALRPSHADFVYQTKYGHRDYRGGGRSSARETVARVAAGSIAQKYLKQEYDIEFLAFVSQVGPLKTRLDPENVDYNSVYLNDVRCPDQELAKQMSNLIIETKNKGDSLGGAITCVIKGVPVGLGEPVFDKLTSDLAKAMLSINAVRGFSIGAGYNAAAMYGSKHNDAMDILNDQPIFKSNNAGGIIAGISTGQTIIFNVFFKPVSTISIPQETINVNYEKVNIKLEGRHDSCVVPRAIPIVEAMAALVIMDHVLRYKASAPITLECNQVGNVNLGLLRKNVKYIDESILSLLAKRQELVLKIAECKAQLKIPVEDINQENLQWENYKSIAKKLGLNYEFIKKIFTAIIAKSKILQNNKLNDI